ncbi:MAG: cyclic nucleotide-binding domain-containing protein [Pseudonocardiaceae bacterium]
MSAGREVVTEDEPAECFYVLLSGTLVLTQLVAGDPVEIVRTDQRGVYAGAVQFYLGDQVDQTYGATARAVADCTFLALRAAEFTEVFRQWYPMAVHLLQGLFVGIRNANALVGQRERLLALGKLSAGLTHELNNPAAAATRAAKSLRPGSPRWSPPPSSTPSWTVPHTGGSTCTKGSTPRSSCSLASSATGYPWSRTTIARCPPSRPTRQS